MSSHPDVSDASLQVRPHAPQLITVGWALRRTALWLLMMIAIVVVGAWLFYAGIDPDEAAAGPVTSGEAAETTR